MPLGKSFRVGDATTINFNGDSEIILRKGVWNHEEALLDLGPFEDSVQGIFLRLFGKLAAGETVATAFLNEELGIAADETELVLGLLDELADQDYLVEESSDESARLMKLLIGGSAIGLNRATP